MCVIIPAWNAGAYIGEAVASVLSQTVPANEIIVVDDGSSDNTCEVLKRFANSITVISQGNWGAAAARNAGIRASSGTFIAFLDADDLWLPEKIALQMEILFKYQDAGMVYTQKLDFCDTDGREEPPSLAQVYQGCVFDRLLVEGFILLSTVHVPRHVLETVGFFDETLLTAEDTHLWLRIARDFPIYGVDRPLVRRRLHAANISDRTDIPVGTIDCLDRIVALFPETHPDGYPPMRDAYRLRGGGLVRDFFHAGRYLETRRAVWRLIRLGCADKTTICLWAVSLLPTGMLNALRSHLRGWRNR